MLRLLLLVQAVVVAIASPLDQLDPRAGCNADNCLRAVRASAFRTRSGVADCSSYFITTVTPARSTSTTTLSFSVISVTTSDVTYTAVHPITSTAVVEETTTTGTTTTTTSTVTPDPAKRQLTDIPSVIPSYASACSGAARYSSACSCVGVVGTTITAPVPLTTITISTTVVATTQTLLTTIATLEVTSVASVAEITTTDATLVSTSTAVAVVEPPFNCGLLLSVCCSELAADFSSGTHCSGNAFNGPTGCVVGFTPLCCDSLTCNGETNICNADICSQPVF